MIFTVLTIVVTIFLLNTKYQIPFFPVEYDFLQKQQKKIRNGKFCQPFKDDAEVIDHKSKPVSRICNEAALLEMHALVAKETHPNRSRKGKKEQDQLQVEDLDRVSLSDFALEVVDFSKCGLRNWDYGRSWARDCARAFSQKAIMQSCITEPMIQAIIAVIKKYPHEPMKVTYRDFNKHDNIHKMFGTSLAEKIRRFSTTMTTYYIGMFGLCKMPTILYIFSCLAAFILGNHEITTTNNVKEMIQWITAILCSKIDNDIIRSGCVNVLVKYLDMYFHLHEEEYFGSTGINFYL